MKLKPLYSIETKAGLIRIMTDGERFFPEFKEELFGSYPSIAELIDALISNSTILSMREIDTSRLNIPDNVSGWDKN